MSKPFAVVILGPTAAGKTAVAIEVAKALRGEIISADSRQFYIGMDIGTAKPAMAERQGIRHHLIDIVSPDEEFNLSDFKREVGRLVREVNARGNVALIVGGTGQYIKALTSGWEIPQTAPDPHLRAALQGWGEQFGAKALHEKLALIDPDAAAVIEYQNLRRTIRAWEVILTSGMRFSSLRVAKEAELELLMVGITRPRPDLYARIDERIEQMLTAGLVSEVAALLARGHSPELPSLSAIGYKEIVRHLHGEISLEEAVVLIKRNTRTYVRRQANWFKLSDPDIKWFDYSPGVAEKVTGYLLSDSRLQSISQKEKP